MKIDDVLALAKAGFTAQQISVMAKTVDPVEAPSPSPAPAPAPVTETGPDTDAVLKQLRILGIQQSTQPPRETVDDILASIINPDAR